MFHNARDKGTVNFCIKRYDGRTKPIAKTRRKAGKVMKEAPARVEPTKYNCLLRARFKSHKISTVVAPEEVQKYQQQFNHLLRLSIDGLKKEKKPNKKSKKQKATQ